MNLREHEVLMLDGHFDYGNGYHGRVYLNPHKIFRQPSLIWRFAQDLIELLPDAVVAEIEVVAGPVMGGALFAHTLAGLLDGRREPDASADQLRAALARRPTACCRCVRSTARSSAAAACCWPTTCAIRARRLPAPRRRSKRPGGTVIATAEICDRLESIVDIGVPNFALAEYRAPENYPVATCPLCKAGQAVTTF